MFTLKNSANYLILLLFIFSAACNKKAADVVPLLGDFVKVGTTDASARSNATGFTIGGKGYLAAGITSLKKLNDLWEFDPTLNAWTQKADFPGAPRYDAAGFSIGDKGYVGTGWDGVNYFKDFYEYNSNSNGWDSIAAFPVDGRQGSVSFSLLNTTGYVGTGFDGSSYLNNFFKYDRSAGQYGTWSQIVSLPGDKRIDAVLFVIDDKAYIGMGTNSGTYINDFYSYDPASTTSASGWTTLTGAFPYADIDKNGTYDRDLRRAASANFVISGRGYLTTGAYNANINTSYEFNPDNVYGWVQVSNFEGASRTDAVGLSINNRGFIVGGKSGAQKYEDVWEFIPNVTQQ